MTKCQITCKSLQKSSKCQNFIRVWHLVIFRADQSKTTTLYVARLHFAWKQVCQSNQHQKFFISFDHPLFINTPSCSDATPWINILSAHYYPHHHSVLFTNCGRQHAFYSNNSYLWQQLLLFVFVFVSHHLYLDFHIDSAPVLVLTCWAGVHRQLDPLIFSLAVFA